MTNNLRLTLEIRNGFTRAAKVFLTLALLCCFTQPLMSQKTSESPKLVGKVNDLYGQLTEKEEGRTTQKKKSATNDPLISDVSISVNTPWLQKGRLLAGEIKGRENSQVFLAFKEGSVEGKAILYKEKLAYKYYSDEEGNVWEKEVSIDDVTCIDYTAASTSFTAQSPPSGSPVYSLQSFPGATAVVMLDFDGHLVENTIWNTGTNADPIDALPANLNESEIIECFKIMEEDFRPFNINITTDEAVYQAAPANRRMRCIFTPTNVVAPQFGGVAIIGSFSLGGDFAPCWAFNGGGKGAGETGSHEIGHTLSLNHDGRTEPSETYFAGHGNWAPIMGVAFDKPVGHWSKGEYQNANNIAEDDIAIIAAWDDIGFREDDHTNFRGEAQELMVNASGFIIQQSGIIEQASDVDVFYLNVETGFAEITVNPAPAHPNLDVLITITDAEGNILFTVDSEILPASFFADTLFAGTYYVHVEGTGSGDPFIDGYSDYSSLGAYTISGQVQNPSSNEIPLVSIASPADGSSFPRGSDVTVTAEATDPDGILSVRMFVNGILLLDDFIPPYSITIPDMTPGTYELTAVATDNQGGQAVSTVATITIINEVPVVSITSPAPNTIFPKGSTISIAAVATDPDGQVVSMKFFNGGEFLGEDDSAPFTFDITNAQEGNYFLTAVAVDNEGGEGSSEVVPVFVPGVAAPSCVNVGSYLFEVVPDPNNPVHISWWVNGDASVNIDPLDPRKATIFFNPFNGSTVSVFAGVVYNQAPWYKEYSRTVQFGGCQNAKSAVVVNSFSSVGLSMYPNPARHEMTVALNGLPIENCQISVRNVNGLEVLKSEKASVNVSALTPGMYHVLVISEGKVYSEKLIIK